MTGSLRAYARHRKCTLGAVQKAVAAGRIPVRADGRVDFAKADAAWAANTRARGPAARSLADAQRRLVDTKRRLAELELRLRRGELVPAMEVRREVFRCARASRDRMMLVPARVMPGLLPLLATNVEPAVAQRVLTAELHAAFDHLSGEAAYKSQEK